jgi:hypothetical protein
MTNCWLRFSNMAALPKQFLFCLILAANGVAFSQEPVPAIQIPVPPPVPPLSQPRSPVSFFRELLAMSPEQRKAALSGKTAQQRDYVQARLAEYESLPVEELEIRLKLLELRWYLLPLLKLSPSDRTSQLAGIPESHRALIVERLNQWDSLGSDLKAEVLENEMTVHYFLRLESSSPAQRERIFDAMPRSQRRDLEGKLEKWRALPQTERQKMYARFQQFFDLPPEQKLRTLKVLPDEERAQLERTLKAWENLPAEQRRECIESFRKFANMSPESRMQFLRNAERWGRMSSREREVWRSLITVIPPSPPGFVTSSATQGQTAPPRGTTKPAPPIPGQK